MTMSAVRAGDVVVRPQRLADSDRYRFFPRIQMGQSRHQGARVEFVDLLLEQANAHHATVGVDPMIRAYPGIGLGMVRSNRHFATPDIRASTSNMHAKSSLAIPIPRAAVRISLLIAVLGKGTSS